jgi:hypothetical protein
VKLAAAIIHTGSPAMRKAMAEPAVSAVAAQGQSVAFRRSDKKRGKSPSSASWDMVRAAPAKG